VDRLPSAAGRQRSPPRHCRNRAPAAFVNVPSALPKCFVSEMSRPFVGDGGSRLKVYGVPSDIPDRAESVRRFCQSFAVLRCRNSSYIQKRKRPTDPALPVIQSADQVKRGRRAHPIRLGRAPVPKCPEGEVQR
jgi:hypothetical protein